MFSGTEVVNRMSAINQQPYDEKGHLLASILAELWNLAPQMRALNRGDGSGWRNLEIEIKNYLRGEICELEIIS